MKMKRIAALLMAGVMILSYGMVWGEELTGGDVIEENEELQDGSVLDEDKNIVSGEESPEEDTEEISEVSPVEADNPEMIPIDVDHFPDEIFRDYISRNHDTDPDGFLSSDEIAAVNSIDVSSKKISSLKGIKYFVNLTNLYCYSNNLSSLDVSKNTVLTSLQCDGNNLTSLDVSENTALTTLFCCDNNLSSLDVSKNTALDLLNCSHNNLSSLDVSNNPALTRLYCDNNNLSNLDMSNDTALAVLNCSHNNLSSLDVSKNTSLMYLGCYDNEFSITSPYDLSTLPGTFDISKASNWQGGTVNATVLTATEDIVTYDYDCGMGYTEQFELIVTASATPTPSPIPTSDWTGNEQITDLKGISSAEGSVFTWSAFPKAEGYLIGAIQNGNPYKQIDFIVGGNNTRYVDKNASLTTYSYYWVFPYKKVNGKVVRGAASSIYAYGIKQLQAPDNLKATGKTGGVDLEWDSVSDADGFIVKRKTGSSGSVVVIADVTGTSYKDTTASRTDNSFYWVYAYKKSGNTKRPGAISSYVYAKAR